MHEGPLSWRVNKDKRIGRWGRLLRGGGPGGERLLTVLLPELYVILLEDVLVLLQKQDERLLLKFHGKNQAGAADTKSIFSPVIKLSTVLVRPVATGEGGAALRAPIGPCGRFHPGFGLCRQQVLLRVVHV